MAIKLTVNSFLKVLQQSRLLPDGEVAGLMQKCSADSVNVKDAAKVADWLVDHGKVTRWQADKLLQGKHKGYFVGKYLLKDLIGRGGMSSVFLARHTGLGTDVAVKVLPQKKVHDTSYLERFKREARAAASVDHPNIVRAFDIDMERDGKHEIHFIVMEYVDGQDLTEMIVEDGLFSPADAAEIIRQAAQALQHAHDVGIVHRDMKPGNLMIEADGTVRLLDLGLALLQEDDVASLTIAYDERVLGTADYLSPEQAVDSHTVDGRADIYGLGCTFYFLLTGHPPFNEGTLPQRLIAHQTKQPPPIRAERPDVTDSLLAIIHRMMKKDPDERYQSATEVAEVLTEWLDQTGKQMQVRVAPPSDILPGSKPTGERPRYTPFGESSVLQTATDVEVQSGETQNFNQLDTIIVPNIEPVPAPARRRQLAGGRRWFTKRMAALVGAVAAIAIVVGAVFLVPPLIDSEPAAVIHVGPTRELKSISAAIRHVEDYFSTHEVDRQLQVIKVDGAATYRERITIDHSQLVNKFDLHIMCDGPDRAILEADGDQPLLKVIRSKNFHFSGFELRAENAKTVIELSEHSPGTNLERLTIRDFTGQAIFARELSGQESSGGAAVMHDIRFETSDAQAVGVVLQSPVRDGSRTAVQLNECRFIGAMLAGVIVNDSANFLEIDACVFSGCRTGIRFAGKQLDLIDVRIGGNTFHGVGAGISFDGAPSADSVNLVVARNLFANVQHAEVAAGHAGDRTEFGRFSEAGFRFNWTSGTVSLDEIDVFANQGRIAIRDFEFRALDPQDPAFLQPTTKTLPLTSGHPQVGFKPWVGAVKPLGL